MDLEGAFQFHEKCRRSDAILQSFIDSTIESVEGVDSIEGIESAESVENDESVEYTTISDPTCTDDNAKDGKLIVTSGHYEYKPPEGLNVKLVRNERSPSAQPAKIPKKDLVQSKITSHTIYLKSEPLAESISAEDSEYEEVYDAELYDMDDGDIDSDTRIIPDEDKLDESENSNTGTTMEVAIDADEAKLLQIKPVRTNKVRLGYTSANKSKPATATQSSAKSKSSANIKEMLMSSRGSQKEKAAALAQKEPKQPKKCEICGNTYMYQHALER